MKVMFYAVVILVHSFHAVLSFPLNETIDLFERGELILLASTISDGLFCCI